MVEFQPATDANDRLTQENAFEESVKQLAIEATQNGLDHFRASVVLSKVATQAYHYDLEGKTSKRIKEAKE